MGQPKPEGLRRPERERRKFLWPVQAQVARTRSQLHWKTVVEQCIYKWEGTKEVEWRTRAGGGLLDGSRCRRRQTNRPRRDSEESLHLLSLFSIFVSQPSLATMSIIVEVQLSLVHILNARFTF